MQKGSTGLNDHAHLAQTLKRCFPQNVLVLVLVRVMSSVGVRVMYSVGGRVTYSVGETMTLKRIKESYICGCIHSIIVMGFIVFQIPLR